MKDTLSFGVFYYTPTQTVCKYPFFTIFIKYPFFNFIFIEPSTAFSCVRQMSFSFKMQKDPPLSESPTFRCRYKIYAAYMLFITGFYVRERYPSLCRLFKRF